MKKYIILLALLFLPSLAWGQGVCTAQPVAIEKSNTAVRFLINYYVDDVPDGATDVKTFEIKDILGATDAQIQNKLTSIMNSRCDEIIDKKYKQVTGLRPEEEILKAKIDTEFDRLKTLKSTILGMSVMKYTHVKEMDTDLDGQPDQQWTIKADGTKTISDITP